MASKRALNAGNLESLGAAALAELLLEVSSGNAVIQRRLRLALAAAEGADGAAHEVRKRLAAIARSGTFVDSRKRKALLTDLEAQHQAITGVIGGADPDQAFELLVRFLELAEGVMERCSDTTGAVIGVFQRAAADLGPLASAARVEPQSLAEQVADLLADNGSGQFDELIPALRNALGEEGLRWLEREFRVRGGPDTSCALRQIAACLGDVDAYLAQFDDRQLSWPSTAAHVALHLLTAGRAEQALGILDGAAEAAASWQSPEWDGARIAVLDGLDRHEEAQQQRWQCFCRTLSIPHLRDYLKRLDDFADVEAEERALQVAEDHPMILLALQVLVTWPALSRAARHVLAHGEQWQGDNDEILSPAAERLTAGHPLAATLLLRSMVRFSLWTGRSKRYRGAAEQLRTCETLAARIDDWEGHLTHSGFMARLRDSFEAKWSFWTLVDS